MLHLILGSGFTGARVSSLLAARGDRVLSTVRPREGLPPRDARGVEQAGLDADDAASRAAFAARVEGERLRVLIAFPPARLPDGGERVAAILGALGGGVERVVFISSTTVYGRVVAVDAATPAAAEAERERLYLDAERAAMGGDWLGLVLRAAAIYGPGRGVLAEGGPRFSHARSMDAVISRIHADDLAAIAAAALASDLCGVYPVADAEPASGRAVLAAWAGEPFAPPAGPDPEGSRRVDGCAIRQALGINLRYPSFRDVL